MEQRDRERRLRTMMEFTVPAPVLSRIHARAHVRAMRRRVQQCALGVFAGAVLLLTIAHPSALSAPPPIASATPLPAPAPPPAPAPTIS